MMLTANPSRIDLKSEIISVLHCSPHFLAGNIRAELHDDEVVLKGIVGSYYQKQLAQESIRAVRGVRRVKNELEVTSRPAFAR